MFWLSKPPYIRRTAAVLVVVSALAWELRPIPSELRPYLANAVEAGAALTPSMIDWREVASGVLPTFDQPAGHFVADFAAGMPLVPGMLVEEPNVPEGWWAVEVPVPEGTNTGTEVRLVVDVRLDPKVIPGVVIRILGDDNIHGTTALVAVPEKDVGATAAALADGSLRTLVGGT